MQIIPMKISLYRYHLCQLLHFSLSRLLDTHVDLYQWKLNVKPIMLKLVLKRTSIVITTFRTVTEALMVGATIHSFHDGDLLEVNLIEWQKRVSL